VNYLSIATLLSLPFIVQPYKHINDFQSFPQFDIMYKNKKIHIYSTRNLLDKRLGLMGVRKWPINNALAFDTQARSFWMRNVPIPLDLVFLDKGLRIIGKNYMTPYSEKVVTVPKGTHITLEFASPASAFYHFEVGGEFILVA
jgi:uncharacterized membrane protein (UPF0127 family)